MEGPDRAGVAGAWGRAGRAQQRIERGRSSVLASPDPTLDPGGDRSECVNPAEACDLCRVCVCVCVCGCLSPGAPD